MSSLPQWYYLRNGQQIGPVGPDLVREALRDGVITHNDFVWREGMADWQPAGSVPEFATADRPAFSTPDYLSYAPPEIAYAGFWKRFAAAVVDWFVMLVPSFILEMIGQDAGGGVEAFISILRTVLMWLYFALMESSRYQGTLGKMALGIKVTDLNGQRIGFGRATGRYFGKIISALILGIGYLMAAFTQRKQALHDIMASCLVVRTR